MPTPSTYYTPCSPIIVGCTLYLNSTFTTYAPNGYYSDGINVYFVSGNTGSVVEVTNCPPSAPCEGDCCFVGGTIILLADSSTKRIEDIKIGDIVISYNESLQKLEAKPVKSIRGKLSNELIRITLANGIVLQSTNDHPYYVNGYKLASYDPISTTEKYNFDIDIDKLKVGDKVHLVTEETTTIVSIEELYGIEQVYTFEVADNHNYYANGILVHNKAYGPICCYNVVTGEYLTITNAGDNHPGCCCLGENWQNASPENCNLGGEII